MRYYIVSEAELEDLERLANMERAVCRARPVPEWATHLTELDQDKFPFFIGRNEEIKK
jgi:hypothetical protein